MSADRRSNPRTRMYKMQRAYDGSYDLVFRDVTNERLEYLNESGWRDTELAARYLEVEVLNRAAVEKLNLVWNAGVVRE